MSPLSDVVSEIEEVAKLGNRVTLTNVQEIQSVLNGTHFRLKAEVTFNVVEEVVFQRSRTFRASPLRTSGNLD